MTVFRPDTSFPYLKVAREHGEPYGKVIRFIQQVEAYVHDGFMGPFTLTSDWQRAAAIAWLMETERRRSVGEKQTVFAAVVPFTLDPVLRI